MAKYIKCILNPKKDCDDCNKCDLCDLNPSKICDNCGKCLENNIEGGMRSLKINKIIEKKEDEIDWLEEDSVSSSTEDDNDLPYDFIEDIEGLGEILSDEQMSEKFACEEFPGLITIKKMK